ncbi:M56 family metallopeptidase [Fulvivirga ligni]|uniref:M56 family metallopeptidase n=1 Tax=Fulvivirga ligni TaxID=2904246 RepID=UPI001F1F9011|nr:M56 family metallopeptidase [Fulvivirga ligni]UII21370.1 hypothetical protein LVD16_26425 [Fulvivirga ligni]
MENNYVTYLLEASLTSSILYLGYLAIKRHSSPTLLRKYLLAVICLSVLFPLLSFHLNGPDLATNLQLTNAYDSPMDLEITSREPVEMHETLPAIHTDSPPVSEPNKEHTRSLTDWLAIGYCIIAFIFVLRIIIAFLSLWRLRLRAKPAQYQGFTYFIVNVESFAGANFFKAIFIGSNYLQNDCLQAIITHEKIHADKWHTVDILLSEFYKAIFWFNPISWMLSRSIRLNTEYEVDQTMTSLFGRKSYANTLIHLSSQKSSLMLYNSFSAFYIKSRIKNMYSQKPTRWYVSFPTMILTLGLSFWLVSCNNEIENDAPYTDQAYENVKKITTTFTSHQADTQDKNSKVVAIAEYAPDHTINRFEQYTSYPYTREYATPRTFWINPKRIEVIMDGLDLGDAERNFLYGNDWPVIYAQLAELGKHPKFGNWEHVELTTKTEYAQSNFPEKIITESRYDFLRSGRKSLYVEEFEYEDDKVVKFLETADIFQTSEEQEVDFAYENDLLTEVSKGNKKMKFIYDDGLLVRSEYYIGANMYNYRKYIYNNINLKIRTEIYNRYNQPEYTINYDYEFYEPLISENSHNY